MECPRGCGAKVVRKDLAAHAAACAKNFKKCKICGDPVRPENAEQHRREKGELHAQILEKQLAEEVAQRKALERRLEERETDARLERIEAAQRELRDAVRDLRDEARRKVEWRFRAADVLARAPTRGDMVKSDTFSLPGAGDMWFELYPRGVITLAAANANKVPVCVRGTLKLTGCLSMLCPGEVVGAMDIMDGRPVPLRGLFPTIEAFATYGEVRIRFELTRAVALVETQQG